MKKYNKALVALSGVLLTVGHVFADGQIEANEAPELLVALGVLLGVFGVRNAQA